MRCHKSEFSECCRTRRDERSKTKQMYNSTAQHLKINAQVRLPFLDSRAIYFQLFDHLLASRVEVRVCGIDRLTDLWPRC